MNNEYRKKLKRYNISNHARELTFSCYREYAYFSDPIACLIFLDHLAEAREQFKFELWAYVIMPDHIHLLIWPGEKGDSVGKLLHRIKGLTGRNYRTHIIENMPETMSAFCVGHKGTKKFRFWQLGAGFDRNLWNAKPVHHSIRYIEANPVRAGLVSYPEKWRWSSAWARKQRSGLMPDTCSIPILMNS